MTRSWVARRSRRVKEGKKGITARRLRIGKLEVAHGEMRESRNPLLSCDARVWWLRRENDRVKGRGGEERMGQEDRKELAGIVKEGATSVNC